RRRARPRAGDRDPVPPAGPRAAPRLSHPVGDYCWQPKAWLASAAVACTVRPALEITTPVGDHSLLAVLGQKHAGALVACGARPTPSDQAVPLPATTKSPAGRQVHSTPHAGTVTMW